MKVLSVVGYSKSGKTTVIEQLVRRLKAKGYRVGTVKNIQCEGYEMDVKGTDTYRHKEAGADMVTGYGRYTTDIFVKERLNIKELIELYNVDYLLLEGVTDIDVPRIVTSKTVEEIEPFNNPNVIAISGVIANSIEHYKGKAVINIFEKGQALVDLICS